MRTAAPGFAQSVNVTAKVLLPPFGTDDVMYPTVLALVMSAETAPQRATAARAVMIFFMVVFPFVFFTQHCALRTEASEVDVRSAEEEAKPSDSLIALTPLMLSNLSNILLIHFVLPGRPASTFATRRKPNSSKHLYFTKKC